jgi:DMSO/TMAO reductase YedYZ molybdopterin-dependent catalytic subunit
MPKNYPRRDVLKLAQWAGLTFITGCGAGEGEVLIHRYWEPVNQKAQELLFSPDRLATGLTENDVDPKQLLVNDVNYNRGYPLSPIDQKSYRLEVGGEVTDPGLFSLADLEQLPIETVIMRHVCVEGWAAIVKWAGIPLRILADKVGMTEKARYVYFFSADGYYESWDLDSALHPQTLLVTQMNGEPLPSDHGAPIRLASPVKLGYKQSKWVNAVAFTASLQEQRGYWEDKGYEWYAGI